MTLQVLRKYGKSAHCAFASVNWATAHCVDVSLNCLLLPKGYLQKPQYNFPRFLELFSNFLYLFTTYITDRSIVLANKQIKFHF